MTTKECTVVSRCSLRWIPLGSRHLFLRRHSWVTHTSPFSCRIAHSRCFSYWFCTLLTNQHSHESANEWPFPAHCSLTFCFDVNFPFLSAWRLSDQNRRVYGREHLFWFKRNSFWMMVRIWRKKGWKGKGRIYRNWQEQKSAFNLVKGAVSVGCLPK